ncbi:glycosyltransferase [Nocardioides sp. SYSU DS0651]|uniref:glycosyltransferase n=1 Tax=Nocardioides sp. SYSU DS0651 TaxID=3415955 RepID=UPI003F4C31C9
MKLLVDAMCAEFGGIRTLVEHVLAQWSSVFPDDELHVAVPAGSDLPTADHTRHEIAVRRPAIAGRPLAQTTTMRSLAHRLRPDAVLATAPTTSVLPLGSRLVTIILDLRHELRPEQFSRGRRLLRDVSYGRTYRLADAFVAISQRSLDDLHELHPGTRGKPAVVAHLGADHVHGWPAPRRTGPAVTFAHHTNKNPDLVLDAWRLLAGGQSPPPLLVLGVGSARRPAMEAAIAERGLTEHVRLAPFLPDAEFQQVLTEAEMIVFPSDFEGFGLPTVEGMALGKPVVIGPEKACLEVAGGHGVVMADWTPAALADAVTRARGLDDDALAAARAWADRFTWERTIRATREALAP